MSGWHVCLAGPTHVLRLSYRQYAESRKLRLKVNGYKDYIEPKSVTEVPAGPLPVAAAA